MSLPLLERFLSSAEIGEVFSDERLLQHMLDFEAALARAQSDCGMLPPSAAEAIASCCRVEQFDLKALAEASGPAGSVVIPLVKALTRHVEQVDAEAALWVHFGSTSQDVLDTAMVLATREALKLLNRSLDPLIESLLRLAEKHIDTPVLARTLMQPAQVTSFGLKCANWAAPLWRSSARLRHQALLSLQVQLGGAVGTLASMGAHAETVRARLAHHLQLGGNATCWHTQRDEWVRLGLEVAVLVGSLGKIATDLALMSQGEVAELAEPSGTGRGGSSAMPNKRNPVASMVALAAAKRAPVRAAALLSCMDQEHERGLGNWQAELAEWPGLWTSAHGAVQVLGDAFAGLQVSAPRMIANIEALHGLVFAEAAAQLLAPVLGKTEAHALVQSLSQRCVEEGRALVELCRELVETDARLATHVPTEALEQAFSAERALQPAAHLARQQLAACRDALQE